MYLFELFYICRIMIFERLNILVFYEICILGKDNIRIIIFFYQILNIRLFLNIHVVSGILKSRQKNFNLLDFFKKSKEFFIIIFYIGLKDI